MNKSDAAVVDLVGLLYKQIADLQTENIKLREEVANPKVVQDVGQGVVVLSNGEKLRWNGMEWIKERPAIYVKPSALRKTWTG